MQNIAAEDKGGKGGKGGKRAGGRPPSEVNKKSFIWFDFLIRFILF